MRTHFPQPTRERWQPLRLGLVDLYLYDEAEFNFRDGHLLLRGNNGTGKSKVLALTLPFLLDGELSPARVEPGGESDKRMEWNLLMAGRHQERLGYTWLEFGKREGDGGCAFLTVGCGLNAVAGRPIDRWYFVTSGRYGRDFSLVGPTGRTLTRERLIETLDGIGHVYRRAQEYRRAIDERLFRLGIDRYESLINLLIQLRQPQLTRRPDEEKLSRALSDALKPVDQAILNVLAEAFHDLEQQRQELDDLHQTHSELDRFVVSYRRYAAVAARRLAAEVRSTHSAYQAIQRELADMRRELEAATAADLSAAERRAEVVQELASARAMSAELRDRREVRELEAAERVMRMAEENADRAATAHLQADGDVELQRTAVADLRHVTGESERILANLLAELARLADVIGLRHVEPDLLVRLGLDSQQAADANLIRIAESRTTAEVRRRTEQIQHLRLLIAQVDAQAAKLESARLRLHDQLRERDAASDHMGLCEQRTQDLARTLLAAWREYLRSLTEIHLQDPEQSLIQLAGWAETLDGPEPASAALVVAAELGRDKLAELRAAALAIHLERSNSLAALADERTRLLEGEVLTPPAPYTRDEGLRANRPGAPLWQLVDFRSEVPEADRAGIEAALECSGILDAWVTPDGQLLTPDAHDAFVVSRTAPRSGPTLTSILEPAIDQEHALAAVVDAATIRRVLESIGGSDHTAEVWVDASGRWRNGVLEGSWTKSAAAFIGRRARDAARRRRLAELALEMTEAEAAVSAAQRDLDRIEAHQQTLSHELTLRPSADDLRAAHTTAAEAQRSLDRAQAKVLEHEAMMLDLQRQWEAALRARDEAGTDLNLPTESSALERVQHALADYRQTAASLWPEARAQLEHVSAVRTSLSRLATLQSMAAQRATEADRAMRIAVEERGRFEGLRASIGASVEDIRQQLERVNARVYVLEEEDRQLEVVRIECSRRLGAAQANQSRLDAALLESGERRLRAAEQLERFASSGLLRTAIPDLELPSSGWAADPVAHLARRIERALETIDSDDQSWERINREITTRFKDLQDGLSARGHYAAIDLTGGWYVVEITFHGQQRSPDDLVAFLADDIAHRERLLSTRERELLEEHLVNEVASHLQELIRDAEIQVREMNDELQKRPTSTGMRLRFVWAPRSDGPPGLLEARARLLRQLHDAWSVEDRAAVSAFLKEQIDRVRAANEHGTWLEHLTEAFDYRWWHRFTIERLQDGRWRSANGPASSGERVLSVTLPLFAAASAHYRSAHTTAPRLVLLDEAFAGVDDDSRAKSIGLLSTFDLDFVMTSEREWGCYATLPGLAIYQLARREGIDAVHVTEWTWDGRTRSRVDRTTDIASPNGITTNGHVQTLNAP